MQKLVINIEKNFGSKNVHIVHFEGAFDGSIKDSLSELEQMIQAADDGSNVIFDFKKLDYLNSYAIGQLVAWQNHLLKIKGQIIIAALNKNVEDILGILGISNLFKIFPDIDSALGMVKN
jgi:anti-anti-sigma factor